MFLVLHRKVGIVFTLSKTIISDFWTQSTLTHTALHTAYSTLYTKHFILHTSHFTLHTAHCILHTAYCTLHTTHCTLHAEHQNTGEEVLSREARAHNKASLGLLDALVSCFAALHFSLTLQSQPLPGDTESLDQCGWKHQYFCG